MVASVAVGGGRCLFCPVWGEVSQAAHEPRNPRVLRDGAGSGRSRLHGTGGAEQAIDVARPD
jgi:hypothetical protein